MSEYILKITGKMNSKIYLYKIQNHRLTNEVHFAVS